MWRKIKSSFIFQKVFSYLALKKKFNIVVYNKKAQRKLDLNLIDLKRYSGLYKQKIYGKTEIKDTYTGTLLFQGYIANGKKNGEGKEYNEEGKLIFQGEYLDGKKWKGKFKEYDNDTKNLVFECEYLYGSIEGEAKEYDKYDGQLLFSGKYSNGKRNGEGIEYKPIPGEKVDRDSYFPSGKIIFRGTYLNGERKQGKEYNYNRKLLYEGEYLNGKRNGKGKIFDRDEILLYEGQLLNGIKNGKGIEYDRYHELCYEGEYVNGKKSGKGKEYYRFFSNYSKQFSNDPTLIFEGDFIHNYRLRGKEYYKTGKLKFEGEYLFK